MCKGRQAGRARMRAARCRQVPAVDGHDRSASGGQAARASFSVADAITMRPLDSPPSCFLRRALVGRCREGCGRWLAADPLRRSRSARLAAWRPLRHHDAAIARRLFARRNTRGMGTVVHGTRTGIMFQ